MAIAVNAPPCDEIQQRPAHRFYLPELDSLRFFAFVAVFICHAGPDVTLFQMGTFGVDLFFALSAYLITELLAREKDQFGIVDIRSFYVRRALRIWPLYFTFLGVTFFATTIPWPYFVFCSVFLGNFGFAFIGEPSNIIFPLWSVSVEEQFYLLWPWAVKRFDRREWAIIAAVLWSLSICFRYIVRAHPAIYLYCTFGRLDSIAAGILVSCVTTRRAFTLSPVIRSLLCLAGAYLWLAAGVCAKGGSITPVYALVAIGCSAFLIATIGSSGWMRNPILMYLGRISYGLYVFHCTALILARTFVPGLAIPVAAILTIILAIASYRWLESPFLRLKKSFEHLPSRPV